MRSMRKVVVVAAMVATVWAPTALAAPEVGRPVPGGSTDEVVVGPGQLDATGRVPQPLPAAAADARGVGGSGTRGRAGVPGAAVGPRAVLVLRVDYTGDPVDPKATGQPYTPDAIRTRLTGAGLSASTLFSEQSAGAVTLTGRQNGGGDVSGWIDLAGTPPVAGSSCDHLRIASDAMAGAAAQGLVPGLYDHVVIVFASYTGSPCDWSGLGEVPGHTTWINGLFPDESDLDASVIGHELGHNLGVAHASSAPSTTACSQATGGVTTFTSSCAVGSAVEYGDPFELMGGGWPSDAPVSPWRGSQVMSAWHRAQLLQLPEAAQQTVTAAGDYDLAPALGGSGVRLLRIVRGTGVAGVRELVIERRAPGAAVDRWAAAIPPVPDGILLRLVPTITSPDRSILLDMQPSTATKQDAPLAVGATFEDRPAGVTVTLRSIDDGVARVRIGGPRYATATPTPVPTPGVTPTPIPTPTPSPSDEGVPKTPGTPGTGGGSGGGSGAGAGTGDLPGGLESIGAGTAAGTGGGAGSGAGAGSGSATGTGTGTGSTVATQTPTPTPSTARLLTPPLSATLVRPSAARGRVVAKDGRISFKASGATRLVVRAGSRTLATAPRSRVSFTLPKALRTTATITIRATVPGRNGTVGLTLRVKKRVATLIVKD